MISEQGRVKISGPLTVDTVGPLISFSAHAADKAGVVIDLQQVETVDSAAVSLMLAWVREAQRNKVKLSFEHIPENLLSLARLYDVAELLPLGRDNVVPA